MLYLNDAPVPVQKDDCQIYARPCAVSPVGLLPVVGHGGDFVLENVTGGGLSDTKFINVKCNASMMKIAGGSATFRSIAVRKVSLYEQACNTPGLHIDAVLINGDDLVTQAFPTDVLLEDITLANIRGAQSILVKDGIFGSVVLRRVRTHRCERSVLLCATGLMKIGSVLIDDCPGLKVIVQGEGVGPVFVVNSPGATIERSTGFKGQVCQ